MTAAENVARIKKRYNITDEELYELWRALDGASYQPPAVDGPCKLYRLHLRGNGILNLRIPNRQKV